MKECKKSGQLSNPHFYNVDNTTFLLVSCGCGHRHSETIQYHTLDCHKRSFFYIDFWLVTDTVQMLLILLTAFISHF